MFTTTISGKQGNFSLCLKAEGPDGIKCEHTKYHAELRAAVTALQFRPWYDDGIEGIIIAIDSTYVALGVTKCTYKWIPNGWGTSQEA